MKFRNTILQLAVVAVFFLVAFLLTRPGKKRNFEEIAGFAQGTTYHIIYESAHGENLQSSIDSLLNDFDYSLSIYQQNSIISRFNRNDSAVVADTKFIEVFNKSKEVFTNTGGAFDITVGPIVNALGFGSSDTMAVDSLVIDSLLQYVGMNKVDLSEGKLVKQHVNMRLDVNAIAQGYSVDLVARFLENRGIRNYMVEIGGEVRAKGKNSKRSAWKIGIDKPQEGNMLPGANLQAIVSLDDKSLATSGNYRKFYEKDGIKYVHTINPKTGYPVVSNLLSATVVADDCIAADAYATALMVMGLDQSIEFLKTHQFLDAFLIYADSQGRFQVYYTPGLEKYIEQ
ncbi:MAG: FAD:protein FMN transferase [Bacteroidales bacterium]|nr:FAD:protein FMN transferase [Bacteroidales bacterium]